jgi:hypothetical protein
VSVIRFTILGEPASKANQRQIVSMPIRNDRQVREKHVYHGIDRKNPRAEIEIEPMQPQTVELLPLDLDVPKERPIKIVPTRADGKPF